MLRQYDLKKIVIPSGATETPPFANSPGAEKALVYLPAGWTGGLTLGYLASRKDFRVQMLSETTGKGETAEKQLQIPVAPIIDAAGAALVSVGVADRWVEVPLAVMAAPGLQITFTVTSREETIYVWQKA